MAQWRVTTFTEVPLQSPTETFRQDSSESVRLIDVSWGSGAAVAGSGRQQAAYDFLGYSTIASDASGNKYISRVLPHAHPDWRNGGPKGVFTLWAEAIEAEPRGVPVQPGNPNSSAGVVSLKSLRDTVLANFARFKVSYTTRQYDLLPDSSAADGGFWQYLDPMPTDAFGNPDESSLARYCVKTMRPGGQYLNLPGGSFQFVPGTNADGKTIPAGIYIPGTPGILEPQYDVTIRWVQVPLAAVGCLYYNPTLTSPPIDNALGKINQSAIWGFAAGTLLMEAPEIELHRDPFGNRIADVVYHFKYQPKGWNYLFWLDPHANNNTDNSGYYPFASKGIATGKKAYDPYDFATLFKVPS